MGELGGDLFDSDKVAPGIETVYSTDQRVGIASKATAPAPDLQCPIRPTTDRARGVPIVMGWIWTADPDAAGLPLLDLEPQPLADMARIAE